MNKTELIKSFQHNNRALQNINTLGSIHFCSIKIAFQIYALHKLKTLYISKTKIDYMGYEYKLV